MSVIAVAFAALVGGAEGFPREAHGVWNCTSAEWAGKAVPDELARQMNVKITATSVIVSPLNYVNNEFNTLGDPMEFACRVDPKAKPRAFELIQRNEMGEHRQLGIDELDGRRLTLCWQHDGKGRPTAFKTVAEPAQMLMVLRDGKAGPKTPAVELRSIIAESIERREPRPARKAIDEEVDRTVKELLAQARTNAPDSEFLPEAERKPTPSALAGKLRAMPTLQMYKDDAIDGPPWGMHLIASFANGTLSTVRLKVLHEYGGIDLMTSFNEPIDGKKVREAPKKPGGPN